MSDAVGKSFVVALNCGSSSIKFALFDVGETPLARTPNWRGTVDGITGSNPVFRADGIDAVPLTLDSAQPYATALTYLRQRIVAWLDGRRITAVAHRIVHGGSKYFEPVRVDAEVLADLKSYITAPAVCTGGDRRAAGTTAATAASGLLRHRLPPEHADRREDAATATLDLGRRSASLRLPRIVVYVSGPGPG